MTDPARNEKAQADLDRLINIYLEGSKKILQTDKILVPMALIINAKYEPEFVSMLPENEEDAVDMIEHLSLYRRLLRGHKQNTTACLLGYAITLNHPDYKDAIAIELEHKSGVLRQVFVPYAFTGLLKKKLKLGEIVLSEPEVEHILHRP